MKSIGLTFGHTRIAVGSDLRAMLGAVEEIMAYLGIEVETVGPAAAASLTLGIGDPRALLPADGEVKDLGSGVCCWHDGAHFVVRDDSFGLELVHNAGRAIFHPDLIRSDDGLCWRLIRYVVPSLLLLLQRQGLLFLHAAALEHEGAGLLLVARSDSGKSTLAYSLVRQGWRYLSDDAILLDGTGAEMEAISFRRMFGLDEVSQRFFPELGSGSWATQVGDEAKWSVPVERLFPERALNRCVPRVIVYPEVVDAPESTIVAIDNTAAFRGLIGESGLLAIEPDRMPAHLSALGRLTRQSRTFKLLGGRDLVENPLRAAEMLSPLLTTPITCTQFA